MLPKSLSFFIKITGVFLRHIRMKWGYWRPLFFASYYIDHVLPFSKPLAHHLVDLCIYFLCCCECIFFTSELDCSSNRHALIYCVFCALATAHRGRNLYGRKIFLFLCHFLGLLLFFCFKAIGRKGWFGS